MSPETNLVSSQYPISSQLLYQRIQQVYVLFDHYDRLILDRFGLNTSQYRTLLVFNDKHGERLTTISERLLLSKSTITRIIDELEDRDWVERIPDPEDRRAQRVVLTEKGKQKRAGIAAAHRQALDEIFQHFSPQEQDQLGNLLESLFNSIKLSLNGNYPGGST